MGSISLIRKRMPQVEHPGLNDFETLVSVAHDA